jgi:hypothetical protein
MTSRKQHIISSLNKAIGFRARLGMLGVVVVYLFNPGAVIYHGYYNSRTKSFWNTISLFFNENE